MFNVLMGILILIVMIGSICLIDVLRYIRSKIGWKTSEEGKNIVKWCNIGIGISVVIMMASAILSLQYFCIALFTITIN